MPVAGPPEDAAHDPARERLFVLDALVAALQRRAELYEILDHAPSAERARFALMERFGLDEIQAVSVLDLQLRRLAGSESARITAERDELRKQLGIEN